MPLTIFNRVGQSRLSWPRALCPENVNGRKLFRQVQELLQDTEFLMHNGFIKKDNGTKFNHIHGVIILN